MWKLLQAGVVLVMVATGFTINAESSLDNGEAQTAVDMDRLAIHCEDEVS
jgi:hypothetical protein